MGRGRAVSIIFFGTPDYVIPILKNLVKVYGKSEDGVVAVVTQSPKPTGRKKYIERSAVDNWAFKKKIPVIYDLAEIEETDLGILASYGKIIPKSTLDKFKYGILNIHPSLLPEFRGPSPVQAAIATGKKQTGLTIIKMDEKIDTGDVVSSFKENIKKGDTTTSLRNRLFSLSSNFLIGLLPNYLNGKIIPIKQNSSNANYTSLVTKQNAFINPDLVDMALKKEELTKEWEIPFIKGYKERLNAESINNFIHSMNSWPIAWTTIRINPSDKDGKLKRLKLLDSHVSNGKLVLDEVQLEGKNPVNWQKFISGYSKAEFADS